MQVNNSLIGKTFTWLKPITLIKKDNTSQEFYICECKCGNIVTVSRNKLVSGNTKSCGCYQRYRAKTDNTVHGLYGTRLHRIYYGIKQRCYNQNNPEYKNYGGRGISMCEEWLSNFMNFYNWALENDYSDELTIDRINNDGNYEPGNCRWATRKQQSFNRSDNRYIECNGKIQTLVEWERETGISRRVIAFRLDKFHWNVNDALFKPVRKINRKIKLEENT